VAAAQPQSDILERIVRAKRAELAEARARVPQAALEKKISARTPGLFRNALLEGKSSPPGFAVIAELKKASPSRGVICNEYDPAAIARSYERAGASALSVLTDREFFQGSLDDLRQVEEAVLIPLLRKDFTLAEYHVYEAAAAGANAVLLIAAILTPEEVSSFLRLGKKLGLDALVEVHTQTELEVALESGAEIVGVNNRNLKTFEVSLKTSMELIDYMPDNVIAVSESGLREPEDLVRLSEAGFDAFLIGERLMSEPDPGGALAHLLSRAAHGEPAS
jgi:indole-3-glycerol phosphate synthase